jgi:hypothetical protein
MTKGERMRIVTIILIACICSACAFAKVRQEDLDAWVGQPVIALEKHPVFITMPVIKTRTSDGTEIWNFVNGRNVSSCSSSGSIYGRVVDSPTYSQFSNCMQRVQACNNIFFINSGVVERYTPVGSGGVRCYTNEALQPHYNQQTNYQ